MALYLLAVDDATGKKKRTLITPGSVVQFVDNDFDVGGGGQSAFIAGSGTVGASNKIDVYWNGKLLREGAGYDYTRNTGANKIDTTVTIPSGAWVRVRVYV